MGKQTKRLGSHEEGSRGDVATSQEAFLQQLSVSGLAYATHMLISRPGSEVKGEPTPASIRPSHKRPHHHLQFREEWKPRVTSSLKKHHRL